MVDSVAGGLEPDGPTPGGHHPQRTRSPNALRLIAGLWVWARRRGVTRNAVRVLLGVGVLSGILTFVAWTGIFGVAVTPRAILGLLVLDSIVLTAVTVLVLVGLVRLWGRRRAGAAGARLHIRLVAVFGVLAAAPAVTLLVLSALFFDQEVRTFFSNQVRTAVTESVAVADAYLEEHKRVIQGDALAMANDLTRAWPDLAQSVWRANRAVDGLAQVRRLSEALVFDGTGRVIGRSRLSFSLESALPGPEVLAQATTGDVVILTNESDDRVRALVRLNTVPSAFLFVGRFVDPTVLRHIERTQLAAQAYEQLELQRSGLQLTLGLIFLLVASLLVITAVAFGVNFANRLARPITGLVGAAERVRAGDLSVTVEEQPDQDEFGTLTRAFNRMVGQLSAQQRELVEANGQLDKRRRFTEGVLAGVSAGVLGLDASGRIMFPNSSAAALLDMELDDLAGKPLAEVMPEAASLMGRIAARPRRMVEGQVNVVRGGQTRTLLVRISADMGDAGGNIAVGFIVTFDDVTELLSAQRKAAWADVARRIAHEIRNPLTPIQLSAERLKRKYLDEITTDKETFTQCTDTIVRQVGDIGRMVDEFSSFARMPSPVMKEEDLRRVCQESMFLQRNAHRDLSFTLNMPDDPVVQKCDRRLVAQALTNLLQNAVDALGQQGGSDGQVTLDLVATDAGVAITVADNGIGLPDQGRERLTEPYVTTREKGTGLGLAIVKKIMEDHGGSLRMANNEPRGARMTLVFGRGGTAAAGDDKEKLK